MICEVCGKEHDGSYGSGRFCSKSCRMKFIASKVKNRAHNLPIREAKGNWQCRICKEIFRTRRELQEHRKKYHEGYYKKPWNKGLTKEINESLKKASETYKEHIKQGLITRPQQGKPVTEETKKKISESMKKAHKEGRAWNIGKSRWNNKHSYPEEFFIQVIDNEFEDKNYLCEYPLEIFSLDFAWPEKKKCIEIDGDQHQRFKEYKERDIRKDQCIYKNGWKILRIEWKQMFKDTKTWIKIAKDFIDN